MTEAIITNKCVVDSTSALTIFLSVNLEKFRRHANIVAFNALEAFLCALSVYGIVFQVSKSLQMFVTNSKGHKC